MDVKEIVSERLKELMEFKNVDVAEFAKACNMPERRVKNLVNCKGVMTIPEFTTVIKVFDVSADYLFGLYPYPIAAPHTEEERDLYGKIALMKKEDAKKYIKELKEEKE